NDATNLTNSAALKSKRAIGAAAISAKKLQLDESVRTTQIGMILVKLVSWRDRFSVLWFGNGWMPTTRYGDSPRIVLVVVLVLVLGGLLGGGQRAGLQQTRPP